MADPREDVANAITIKSGKEANDHLLAINEDGSINTVPTVPEVPEGGVEVIQEAFGDVATTSGDDTIYTITNGKTLRIVVLLGGSETTTGGSVVELFEDPNGDLTVLNRISTVFINGVSEQVLILEDFVGDGTNRIVLRRRGYAGSAREMFAQWRGFEE